MRYAKRRERRGSNWMSRALVGLGALVARNPVAVGGTTAFLVSLSFVSANALFYQPQMHPSAFVSTRSPVVESGETLTIEELPRPSAAPRAEVETIPLDLTKSEVAKLPELTGSVPKLSGTNIVREVQIVLSDLGLYSGEIDGLEGPQTRSAIEAYRRIIGEKGGSEIDTALLRQLGLDRTEPQTVSASGEGQLQTASLQSDNDAVRRVQAGLKAFGNDDIEVDGILGSRTHEAITEFQSLFGLPVTGEPDRALITKMQEIGLIQ